jgi:hypothetical protein
VTLPDSCSPTEDAAQNIIRKMKKKKKGKERNTGRNMKKEIKNSEH